jgi:putative ABC transport system permease protein
VLNDLRFAIRTFLRNPAFTAGAVLTLALGIGVNSTIFTLTNSLLFRSVPGISEPQRLAWVSSGRRDMSREMGMSYPDFLDYRDASREVFSDIVAFRSTPLSLAGTGEPARVRGQFVSGSFFRTLGVTPAEGRVLNGDDDRRGAAQPLAVLSHRLWTRRFGNSPDILRQSMAINGRSFTVVGVAAPGFRGPMLEEAADVWLPLATWPDVMSSQRGLLDDRSGSWLQVMGRLRPEATLGRAQSVLSAVASRLATAHADTNADRIVTVSQARSLSPSGRSELVPLAVLLLTVTMLVLVIACANVANLLLARGAGRASELGIRVAIGATRQQLLRQLLTESLALGTAGAVAGLLLSFWGADILVSMLPPDEFAGLTPAIDARVLLFTALAACGSVCVFGLVPAFAATRSALLPRLRETPSAGGRRSRLQGTFVVAQLSLSLVLLLAAGLSLRALQKAGSIDLGFNPEHLFTASYDLVLQNYPPERRDAFRQNLRERINALPGVISAAIANLPPLSGTMVSTVATSVDDAGQPAEARAYLNAVGPQYFGALQLPILRGRGITDIDRRGAPGAAVVNETLAHQLWGAADPLGRSLRLDDDVLQVVGVARNSKYDEATEEPRAFLYLSLAQHAPLDRETILARTAGLPSLIAPSVQAQLRALDPALPVFDVRTFDDVLKERADKQRGLSALFAAFGSVALLLAALGLYSVMAYAVARRTREIGVRLALGATPAQLTRLIARDGLRLALIGVAIGCVFALPLAQLLGALIFGIHVADLGAFAGTCALLVAVALIAALLPARRASRVDPMEALRAE